jgi:hypothetical protein
MESGGIAPNILNFSTTSFTARLNTLQDSLIEGCVGCRAVLHAMAKNTALPGIELWLCRMYPDECTD